MRIAPYYRLDQSRVEAYTTGFSQSSIFIPSPFSGRTNGAQWRQGESKFLPCFRSLNTTSSHRIFSMGYRRTKSTQGNTNFQKESFWQTTSGSLPAGLNLGYCAVATVAVCGFGNSVVFGVSLRDATSNLPSSHSLLKQKCAPRWEKA